MCINTSRLVGRKKQDDHSRSFDMLAVAPG